MTKKIVTRKSLKKVHANTRYVACTFYLEEIDAKHLDDFAGVEFENCSFRGETHVEFCKANLTYIPSCIFSISSIRSLQLDNNKIKILPATIRNLTYLGKLSLRNNQLREIPSQIVELSHLESLYLSCNQLQSLPWEIGHLSRLQDLELDSNQIAKLPDSVELNL